MKITKEMNIGEIVQEHPISAEIMMSAGLHCIGCHVSAFETLEQGCQGHGMLDEEINKLVDDINKSIEQEAKKE